MIADKSLYFNLTCSLKSELFPWHDRTIIKLESFRWHDWARMHSMIRGALNANQSRVDKRGKKFSALCRNSSSVDWQCPLMMSLTNASFTSFRFFVPLIWIRWYVNVWNWLSRTVPHVGSNWNPFHWSTKWQTMHVFWRLREISILRKNRVPDSKYLSVRRPCFFDKNGYVCHR
jgi:hypothetical protein